MLKFIEKNRESNLLFWRFMIIIKDFLWTIIFKIENFRKIIFIGKNRLEIISYDCLISNTGYKSIPGQYILIFIRENSKFITGNVLEIENDKFSRYFKNQIKHLDILDIDESNLQANIHADLRTKKGLPKEKYDCIILTHVLDCIDDYESALKNIKYMLKKDGVLLCTIPCLERVSNKTKTYFRFTQYGASFLFNKLFGKGNFNISFYGNLYSTIMYLNGFKFSKLNLKYFKYNDLKFPILIAIVARKK